MVTVGRDAMAEISCVDSSVIVGEGIGGHRVDLSYR